jgi:translocation and assembly module TamB
LLRQTPNTFEKIKADVSIKDNHAKIEGAFFIKDKQATIKGQLAWQDVLTLNIDVNGKQLPFVFPPQLVMTLSPALNISLQEKVFSISGDIDVVDGSYNIEKLPEGSITLSDDVIIVDQNGQETVKASAGFAIKTNVNVNIFKAFNLSGQGLESNLSGQLHISQQVKEPLQIFGNIQSDKGTYHAYGQRLTIEKGEVNFNGPVANPYLNLRASRHIKAEDIKVGLDVTGLANNLKIQLFSTPTMEAPEMLSYLARGRGLDSGKGNSTAAASLLIGFGVTNSVGLFDQIEKIPFISNIAVDTEGEGDTTQATISGYVGNRIYLKYGIGVYEPVNELTVRLFLLNRLWLEVVSGIEQSSDIYYSFDIE